MNHQTTLSFNPALRTMPWSNFKSLAQNVTRKLSAAIILLIFLCSLNTANAQNCPGVNCAWQYRVPIEIINTGIAVSNYQVSITINTAALVAAGKMNPNGDDIRFVDHLTCSNLPYWIESGMTTASTVIWVNVNFIPGNYIASISMYYGNPAAAAASNGNTTFINFDDFSGASLDLAKWTPHASGTITVGGGNVTFNTPGSNDAVIVSNAAFAFPYISEMKVNMASGNWPNLYQHDNGTYSNGAGLADNAGTMFLANSFAGCSAYGANAPFGSSAAGSLTGIWQIVRTAAGTTINWPGGTLTSGTIPAPTANQQTAFGLLCSGIGNLQVDWFRARQYYAAGTTQVVGTEVANSPALSITGNLSFCSGSSTTLDAGPGYSLYNWSTGATSQTINVNTAATFTVTVTDGNGCTGSASATTTVNPSPDVTVPADTAICNGTLLPTGTFNFSTVTNFGFDGTILIAYADNGPPTQLRNDLLATSGVIQVDLFDAGTGTPGLALMQQYDIVVMYSTSPYSNAVALGDTLADYVDANGTVVICAGAFFGNAVFHPGGRWASDNYSPYITSFAVDATTHNLGTFTAGHPLMTGVSALTSGTHLVVPVAGGATEVAQWDNGHSLIAFKGRVVGITAFIGSSSTWTGDFAKVIVNAGNWLNGFTTFSWTNNNTAIGLAASGTGNSLPAFTATNVTSAPVTATITVTASYIYGGATCTDTASFTITVNPAPAPVITGNLSFCAGSSTTLNAGVFAGYNWSTGATTQTISVNASGTYTVTVTGASGCTGSASATVTQLTSPDIGCHYNHPTCVGGNDGTAYVIVFTTSPVTYLWNTGATTDAITVAAGVYTVTVTDANGCTSTCESYVYDPEPIVTSCSATPVTCFGGLNGTASVTAYEGESSPAFGYLWSTGGTTSSISGLAAGTYTVTVTDPNSGCTATCSSVVTQPAPVIANCSGSNVSCNGGSNGSASVTATAPPGNITVNVSGTYFMDDVSWTLSDASNTVVASGGPYGYGSNNTSALIAAVNGPFTFYIEAMGPYGDESATFNIYCNGNVIASGCVRGVISLFACTNISDTTVSGLNCANTFTYLWSNGGTNASISGLTAGNYCVTVTDVNGCTGTCCYNVTQPTSPVNASCSATPVSCFGGSNGTASVTASGGTPGYSYLWSTAAVTSSISGLSAGTYTVTVTDLNGCTATCNSVVTQPSLPLSASCSSTGSTCSGAATGSASVTASGGTPPYTYLWSTAAVTSSISGLSTGNYTVTVTDNKGCTATCAQFITAYNPPVCSITGGNFCQGSSTQLCAATNTGYLWSTGATTQCITVTSGGTYTVTVTNANGCTGSCSKTVTAYPLPACTISGNIAYCQGSTTQLCGPAGATSYLWSIGATTQCIAAAGGDYTVTVTNANGCTSSCSITTHLRLLPVCAITGNNFCSGSSSQLCATTAPAGYVFSYAWSTGATTQCITVTTGGTYTVNITNQYGCSSSCSKTITVNPTPVCTISGNIAYCQGSTTQLCGTPGMSSYLWSTGATTQCIAAAGGDFTVTVTNSSGCTSSCSITTHLRLLPVCSITGNNFCTGSSTQLCATTAPAGYVFSYAWSTGATTQCITVSAGGTYSVTISNQYGCTSSCSKAITKYALPTCSITGTASVCPGSSTQWCAPAGLAGYLWSNGATTQCITVNAAATYTVTVTNTTGCTKSCSKALTVKALPACTVTGTASVCPGSSAQWCAPAGLAGYLWSNGATTQCITVSTAGTYIVTVTNTTGCTKSCSKTLTIKGVPSCLITGTASICPGGATQWCAPAGLAAYLWSTGATTQCISVSIAGVYTVTTTNGGGCTSSCIKTLTIKTPPSCSINGGNICPGGSAQLCASANAANYLWSTGATTKCITVSAAGIYTITVTGTNGCTSSCSKSVTVSSLPNCAITWNHAVCQGSSAQFCAGAGLSSYLWNTGATTQCVNISTAADYTVTVSNTSGCTNSCTVKVIVYAVPVCSITGNSVVSPGQTTPVCAPAGLTYLWNNGATTQCRNVAAGTYTVTVTNASGCTSSCSKTVTSAAKMVEPVVIGGDNGAIEASAYPNPFNETATIEFRNTIASGHVVVELFNLTGSKMAVLFDRDVEKDVTYQSKVDSEDLAEGVYFYRIVSGDNIVTGKLILLKQ